MEVEVQACTPEPLSLSLSRYPAFPHSFSPQFLVLLILVGLLLLAYMAETKQVATYEGVMLAVCGPVVKVLADISIIMYGFGANTAFLVVIGDQLQDCECGGFGDWVEGEGVDVAVGMAKYKDSMPLCMYMFLSRSFSLCCHHFPWPASD